MPRALPPVALLVSVLAYSGCAAQRASSQIATPAARSAPAAAPQQAASHDPAEKGVWMGDILEDVEELTYGGYVVQKRHRKVKIDWHSESGEPVWGEGSYVVIKRGGRVLATFDAGLYTPLGNATSFGLFPLLGDGRKQLIVSQDIFRGGKQWIVSLSPRRPRVIYDGAEFGAGREGADMGVVDLDGDGVYEITQPLTSFYGFESLPPGWTPLPTVIFKYDARARRYLPANARFQDYQLRDVGDAKARVEGPQDRLRHLSGVLDVVLSYVFAGREREGWAFYEEAYRLPDKAGMRKKIRAELGRTRLYRLMYGRAAKGET